ncbi:MAG: FHA domain-containing protein [Candidatus Rifleibacteriota bacterium]
MSEESKKTVFRKVVIPDELKKKFIVGNTPPYLGKPFEINPSEEFTIGREEERSLQLASDMVSRMHATVNLKDGKCILEDKGSSNGTYLNNNLIEPGEAYVLTHRDIIKFDTFEFIYIDTEEGDLWETLKPLSREGSQIITFYSPKGGSGISSVVVNLANVLASETDKKVAVVDLDLRFGDILTYSLGKSGLTINELIQEQEITPENIVGYLHKGEGYDFLQAPKRTELAELVNPGHIKSILWSLQNKYDFVLVDCKCEIDDISITAWEISNLIYLTATPEIGHLLALKKIVQIMNKFKFPESKVKILINKLGREGCISEEEVKKFFTREVITLPYVPEDAIVTSNGGKLVVKERPGSSLTQGIKNLQKSITGEEVIAEEGGIFAKLKSALGF